jgi:hypothetical protein
MCDGLSINQYPTLEAMVLVRTGRSHLEARSRTGWERW